MDDDNSKKQLSDFKFVKNISKGILKFFMKILNSIFEKKNLSMVINNEININKIRLKR